MQLLRRHLRVHVAWINRRTLDPNVTIPALPPGYTVRQLTAADYDAATKRPELEISEAFVKEALERGSFCVGAFHDGQLVSYVWRALSATPISRHFQLVVQKPIRYGYKALTLPEHRGKHLQAAVGLFSDRLCCDLGYTTAVAYIETHNYPSIRSDARRGNKHVGWILWVEKGPLLFCYTSRGASAVPVAIARRT